MQDAGARLSKAFNRLAKETGIETTGLENIQDCVDSLINAGYATNAARESERSRSSGAGNGGYKGKRGPQNFKGSNMGSPQDTGGPFLSQGGSQGSSLYGSSNGSMPPFQLPPGNGLQPSPLPGPHWRPQQQMQGQPQRSQHKQSDTCSVDAVSLCVNEVVSSVTM